MTICVPLTDRALVEVTGEDRVSFLQGLLSQSLEALSPGEARYGALLTPQGRLLFDLFMVGRPEAIWLDVAAARRDDLLTRLKIYRLRARVDIRPLDAGVWTCWPEPPGPGWVPDPRREGLAWRAWGPAAPPAVTGSLEDWRGRRLAFGVGDAVLSSGLIHRLSEEIPGARFTIVAGPGFRGPEGRAEGGGGPVRRRRPGPRAPAAGPDRRRPFGGGTVCVGRGALAGVMSGLRSSFPCLTA